MCKITWHKESQSFQVPCSFIIVSRQCISSRSMCHTFRTRSRRHHCHFLYSSVIGSTGLFKFWDHFPSHPSFWKASAVVKSIYRFSAKAYGLLDNDVWLPNVLLQLDNGYIWKLCIYSLPSVGDGLFHFSVFVDQKLLKKRAIVKNKVTFNMFVALKTSFYVIVTV